MIQETEYHVVVMTQLNNVTPFPQPDPEALTISDRLCELIKQRIVQHGNSLSFDEYMSLALYEPGLGYYSAGSCKFGEAGDFVTAPEISPVFSRCVARQCEEIIARLEQPVVVELGAGSGVMASDVLQELQARSCLPEAYWILETSADLRERQQTLLKERVPEAFERVRWLDTLPAEPFSGIVLANEVVDALPIKRFKKTAQGFAEMGVGVNDGDLDWQVMPAGADLVEKLQQVEEKTGRLFADGYISELNTGLQAWLAAVAEKLASGVMLVFDYGYPRHEYYHPDRSDGTLLCYYRHRVHNDPFLLPGLQDITASVDFTGLAEAAIASGLDVKGYTTQAYFLMATGLQEFTADMTGTDSRQQAITAQQIRTLTMPGEMGERIKVMALTRQYNHALKGFSVMDQRARL